MAQASAEKLEHTGPAETKRVASVPQSEQLASTQGPPFPKGKGTEPSRARDRKESIQCQRSKENSSRGKRKRMSIPLQKDSKSQSNRQTHPHELSEN